MERIYSVVPDINMDKLKKTMKSNKTFETFILICSQYNICIFGETNGSWYLKSNEVLIDECKAKRHELYHNSMKHLGKLMRNDIDSINERIQIDNISSELKKGIKNLDLIISLLKDVYNDKCLSKMTDQNKKRDRVVLIEHYSNSS
jgi:hypothetical protein